MINNPFVSCDADISFVYTLLGANCIDFNIPNVTKDLALAGTKVNNNHSNHQYVNQPSIAQLIAQLHALKLFQLEGNHDSVSALSEILGSMKDMLRQLIQDEM